MNKILAIGIFILPFYEVLMMLMPHKEIAFADSRQHKAVISLLLMLIFIFLYLKDNGLKRIPNIWLIGILVSAWASHLFGPVIYLPVKGLMMQANWNYVSLAQLPVYLLFFMCIYSVKELEVKEICKYLVISGAIMAGYVILQSLGLDQFSKANPNDINDGVVTSALLGGNLGQPTIVAPFMAMIAPIALNKSKWLFGLIVVAVLMTKSLVAIAALSIGMLFYFLSNTLKKGITFCLLLGVIALVIGCNIKYIEKESNGRFQVWSQVIKDYRSPIYNGMERIYPLTGKGVGSFNYLFSHKAGSNFSQAHSEPIEILYGCGILGLFVYLMAHINAFRAFLGSKKTKMTRGLFCSFVILTLCSFGTFVYHLAVYGFFLCIILGCIYKQGEYYGAVEG